MLGVMGWSPRVAPLFKAAAINVCPWAISFQEVATSMQTRGKMEIGFLQMMRFSLLEAFKCDAWLLEKLEARIRLCSHQGHKRCMASEFKGGNPVV